MCGTPSKDEIRSCTLVPKTIRELKAAAVKEWKNIPQSYIQDIIDGLLNRLQENLKQTFLLK